MTGVGAGLALSFGRSLGPSFGRVAIAIDALLLPLLPLQTSPKAYPQVVTESESAGVCRRYEVAFRARDASGVGALLAADFEGDMGNLSHDEAIERLKQLFATHPDLRLSLRILSFYSDPPCASVIVCADYRYSEPGGSETSMPSTYVWVLARNEGQVEIQSEVEVDSRTVDLARADAYESATGGFRFERPPGWLLLSPKKKGPALDAVFVYRPSSRSVLCVGAVDLPHVETPEAMQLADNTVIRQMAGDQFQLLKSGPIEVDGITGYQSQIQCTLDGRPLCLWRMTFLVDQTVYAVHTLSPPDLFAVDRESFERAVTSLRFFPSRGPARGAVDGRIFRSADLGCQFAAPAGWSVRPARSDLALQVYVTPPEGESFVLVGAEDFRRLLGKDQIQSVIDEVQKSLERVDASLKVMRPARDVVVDGRPAKEIVWDLPLGGSPRARRRKAVYFALGENICFIHCDAIPPDTFERMEPDFDRIVRSFVRSQE